MPSDEVVGPLIIIFILLMIVLIFILGFRRRKVPTKKATNRFHGRSEGEPHMTKKEILLGDHWAVLLDENFPKAAGLVLVAKGQGERFVDKDVMGVVLMDPNGDAFCSFEVAEGARGRLVDKEGGVWRVTMSATEEERVSLLTLTDENGKERTWVLMPCSLAIGADGKPNWSISGGTTFLSGGMRKGKRT